MARVLENEGLIRRASLFQVLLNYHESSLDTINLPGMTFASLRWQQPELVSEMTLTACDIVFDVRATATKFTGHVNYKTDTVGIDVVADMIPGFGRILEQMSADMGTSVSLVS